MDPAGVPDERGPRSVAERDVRDRQGRRPHIGTARPGAVRGRQGGAAPTPSAAEADRAAAVAEAADQRQADYFLRLLTQHRRVVEQRIEGYRKAIASAEASGNTEGAAGLRRTARIEQHEREKLDGMIDKLHRRFPAPATAEGAAGQRRPRVAVR